MQISDTVFFLAASPNLIVWDYRNHRQFELDKKFQKRLIRLISDPSLYNESNPVDRSLSDAGILVMSSHSDEWGWDILSRIYHLGTKNIPYNHQPHDENSWAVDYLAHCEKTLKKTLLRKPALSPPASCRPYRGRWLFVRRSNTCKLENKELSMSTGKKSTPLKPIDWDGRSVVRSRPNEYHLPLDIAKACPKQYWYPRKLIPFLSHPRLESLAHQKVQVVLANQLVAFLDYTIILEHTIVNRALEAIIHDHLWAPVPAEMKKQALQLYTDEGYHALFSEQIAQQVAKLYNIERVDRLPKRIARLQALTTLHPDKQSTLIFACGFVSETIIAKELVHMTRDHLVPGVYQMFQDHLADECNHSRYFCAVFDFFWRRADRETQHFLASIIPSILDAFFMPDLEWCSTLLSKVGIDPPDSQLILADVFSTEAIAFTCRTGASATLSAMKKSGVFADAEVTSFYLSKGLIVA